MFNLSYLNFQDYHGQNILANLHILTFQAGGPNTNLKIRLDQNDKPKPEEYPLNIIDASCKEHDIKYRDAGDDLSKKREADRMMLKQLNAIADPTIEERLSTGCP